MERVDLKLNGQVSREKIRRHGDFVFKKKAIRGITLPTLAALVVYLRLQGADYNFSYDYAAYINIIERISDLSFSEILGENLIFPYVHGQGITTIEVGFALLIEAISLTGASPETSIAFIAALSVALRVHVMHLIGVPSLWILLINIYAITLFEANALRLGVASSFLLYGLRNIYWSRRVSGILAMIAALSFHLQVLFFIAPFLALYFFSSAVNRTKLRFAITLLSIILIQTATIRFIPMISNEKVQKYMALGSSGSTGITISSMVAAVLFLAISNTLPTTRSRTNDANFFATITACSLPSLLLLILLTNLAVIGDRTWQLAFIVLSSFFFINWEQDGRKRLSLFLLAALMLIAISNVLLRYPLSNFFSPPLPTFTPVIQ